MSAGDGSTPAAGALAARCDRLTLAGIALGLALLFQPWWALGFRLGFFLTAAATLAQVVTSHLLPREAP